VNPTLYDYWRSSAAYRVRIGLNLKGINWEHSGVSLIKDGGEQNHPQYARVNPQKLVPALEVNGNVLTQSLAILEYLDEHHPEPCLLPTDGLGRARVRALSQLIASDIHPLNNLRVLNYLEDELNCAPDAKLNWYHHWITEGFSAFETMLTTSDQTAPFCYGDQPSMADCCLIPQVYNARRFGIDLNSFPEICRIDKTCAGLDAFASARPENQPDAT
jgi:maleylacetoacetate isomerase